jgi:hypothetical protein
VRLANDAMYLAAHFDNSTLAVWRWPDAAADPTFNLVKTSLNGDGAAYSTPYKKDAAGNFIIVDGFYQAEPYRCLEDGAAETANWCGNSTDRVTSAWISGNRLGFAWNVGQDTANGWNYASIWAVILDADRLSGCAAGECVIAKPKIKNKEFAFQWPAITPDSQGNLGLVALYGGGTRKQSCSFAVRAADADPTGGWEWSAQYYASDRDPLEAHSGDYLNIWPGDQPGTWHGSCMIVQAANASNRTPSTVIYPFFGRRADFPTP